MAAPKPARTKSLKPLGTICKIGTIDDNIVLIVEPCCQQTN
jgi:hypothetical protein